MKAFKSVLIQNPLPDKEEQGFICYLENHKGFYGKQLGKIYFLAFTQCKNSFSRLLDYQVKLGKSCGISLDNKRISLTDDTIRIKEFPEAWGSQAVNGFKKLQFSVPFNPKPSYL
jgi:hypothetical protein